MSGQLDGKVIWVTGAGRGLGRAYAEGLAAEGAPLGVEEIDRLGRQMQLQCIAAAQAVAHLARGARHAGDPAGALRAQ